MPRLARRRVAAAASWTAGGVLLLGAVVLASAPLWVRLEPVRRKIESAVSAAAGGSVRLGRIEYSWFPRPAIVVREVRAAVRGKVSGTVRSASVHPALLPLLRGRVRFSRLSVEGPDLTVFQSDGERAGASGSAPDPSQAITPFLAFLAERVPGLAVDVAGGRVAFSRGGRIVAAIRDLDARLTFPPKELRLDVRCTADLLSLPAGEVAITGESAGLSATVVAAESGAVRATFQASAPSVSLRRPGRRVLEVAGLALEGTLDLGQGTTRLELSRLSLAAPRLRVEGTYRAERTVPRAELAATGALDVTSLRGKLLPFADDVAVISDVFAIVRGGELSSLSIAVAGASPADLGVFERMSIRAALAGGSVHLEGPGLDLEEARADVSIDGGLLVAERAAARVGTSRARDGHVRVGLGKGDRRLRVDARVDADLSELVPTLSRVIPGGPLHDELSLVEDLSGSAAARLTIGNRVGALKTGVQVSAMDFAARYRRIPWPVRIREGAFFYDGGRVGVSRLSGSVGGSTLSGLTATVRLAGPASFEDLSGTIEAPLGEVFPWLAPRAGIEALRKEVPRLEGDLSLSIARLAGPVSKPGDLSGEATARLKNVILESPHVRGPLEIESGEIRIGLAPGGALSLAGGSTIRGGPRLAFDLVHDADGTNVRDVTVEDEDSFAAMAADLRKGDLDLKFKGRLHAQTASRFLPGPQARSGWIAGDLRAHLPRGELRQATADGRLEAARLDVPTPAGPLSIETLDVRAAGSRLDVTASAVLDEQRVSIAGTATLAARGLALDGEVATHDLAWERVERAVRRLAEPKEDAAPAAPAGATGAGPPFTTSGGLRVCVGSFTVGSLTWTGVEGGVVFGGDSVGAEIRKAEVCGISTTGRAELLPGGTIAVDAGAASAGPNLGETLACLGVANTITGRYGMNARVRGEGRPAELPQALRGTAALEASKGGFGKAGLLAKIGRTLRAADVFSGKKEVFDEANHFDDLSVQGDIGDGALTVREAVLKMPSVTMVGSGTVGYAERSVDLVVLAYPLSSVDKVVQAIPVVRDILGKDFLSVAVRVNGGFDDPKVAVTPGQDVARGLVNMLARTVKLPVEVFTPPSP